MLTAELVFVGFGSRDLVRRFVGVWVAMFLYRRPLLAVFDACFAWCRVDGADIFQIVQLPSEVVTDSSKPRCWLRSLRLTYWRRSRRGCMRATHHRSALVRS